MILPMMGLLFTLFAGGLFGALILCFVPRWRWLALFALIPILGATGAMVSCCGLAVGLERLFDSTQAGGIGFFGGYFLGGLSGAGLGCWLALHFVQRFQLPNRTPANVGSTRL